MWPSAFLRARLLARPRSFDVEAAGEGDPALAAALRARFGDGARIVPLGPSTLSDDTQGRARVLGVALPWPGVHRMRVVSTDEGERELAFPLAGVTRAAPLRLRAREGRVVVFDVDRDPVQLGPRSGWKGASTDIAVTWGPLPARRIPCPSLLRDLFVRHVGAGNAMWLAVWFLASLASGSAGPLLAAASYVHYALYAVTLRARGQVAFVEFVRDALLFKGVSMACLVAVYLAWPSLSWPSLVLIVLGVAVSSWAAATLGFRRTYFGVELGLVPPRRIASGPYALLPHPMILGAVVALVGHALQPAARAAWPWLVPLHILCYLAHLAQEALPAPRRGPRPGVPSRAS
jgi:hypothetical protein